MMPRRSRATHVDCERLPLRGTAARTSCLLFLGALLLASCTREGQQTTAAVAAGEGEGEGIEKTFERGPVTVTMMVDRKEITIADRLNLTLRVDAEEEYSTELPRFGEKLEQFGIVDYETSQPTLVDDGKVRIERSYVLEPFLSGEYKVPSMTVRFWKEGEGDEPKVHELETEELSVTVSSLLPETLAELAIEDIVPPMEMPAPPMQAAWPWLSGGGAVLCLLGFVVWRARRKRLSAQAPPPLPADEIAYRELEALIAEDLVGKGEIKLFYTRVSDILRRYIENRFGLHAPERTTEEFLYELRACAPFGVAAELEVRLKAMLKEFLTHCDLVKFAEHRPPKDDIQRTFDCCRSFIAETREGAAAPAG